MLLLLLLLKAVGFSGCAHQTKAGHVTTTSLRRLTPARIVAFLLYYSGGTGALEDAVNVTVARPSKVGRRLVVVDAKKPKGDGNVGSAGVSGRVELNGVGEGRRLGALAHRTRHAQSSGHFGVEGGHGLVEGPTRGIARHLVQSAYKGPVSNTTATARV